MGVVMRLALTWVGLGLLAKTAVATLSQEARDELDEELNQVNQDYGLFVDPAEDELMNLLADNGDNEVPDDESQEPYGYPEPRYARDSPEVIESIDEIDSITPIKTIQEVKSIKKVKSILPVPDDIAKKFIADHNLVPTDGDGPEYVSRFPKDIYGQDITDGLQYGAGSGKYDDSSQVMNQEEENSLRTALEDVISTLNSLVEELGDQHLCKGEYEPEPEPSWNDKPTWSKEKPTGSKESKLPFGKDDIKSIDEITSMQEVKSMLPVKKITEVKSITPIKSIQEVTGLYELTDEQAD